MLQAVSVNAMEDPSSVHGRYESFQAWQSSRKSDVLGTQDVSNMCVYC